MKVALSLPTGDGFGWGCCGDHLRKEISDYMEWTPDGFPKVFPMPMIHGIQGVNMLPGSLTEWSKTRNVGLCFIEESELVKKFIPNAQRYFDHICAGSTWNAQILRDAGLKNVSVAIQGVDTDYFKPLPVEPQSDKFVIFSGGKMEWRKGTDIAMKAIGIMMQRHKDVHAIAAWHNPWKFSLDTMSHSAILPWNGIVGDAVKNAGIDLDRLRGPVNYPMKHLDMLHCYQQADIGLFPNRVEGGTNMVMCEFMACGKPVVAMAEHGHADVVDEDCRFTIVKRKELTSDTATYWEPELDDVVDALEYAYGSRLMCESYGRDNRERMKQFTWVKTARALLAACEG